MYGPTMLMEPMHHKFILDALKELDSAREGMMETLLECSGTDAADLLMNQYEVPISFLLCLFRTLAKNILVHVLPNINNI